MSHFESLYLKGSSAFLFLYKVILFWYFYKGVYLFLIIRNYKPRSIMIRKMVSFIVAGIVMSFFVYCPAYSEEESPQFRSTIGVEDRQVGEVVGEDVERADPQQADEEAAQHADPELVELDIGLIGREAGGIHVVIDLIGSMGIEKTWKTPVNPGKIINTDG
jgi:hypothetical protein